MIVPMKKATVITRKGERQEALRQLRKLGVLHLSDVPAQVPSAQEWREKRDLLEKALAAIGSKPGEKERPAGDRESPLPGIAAKRGEPAFTSAMEAARAILDRQDAIRALDEELAGLEKEALRLLDWQGVSLPDLRAIRDQGYEVRFFEVPPGQLDRLPSGQGVFVVRRSKTLLWVALVLAAGAAAVCDLKPLELPPRGAAALEELQAEKRTARERLLRELDEMGAETAGLERALREAAREIEMAEAAAAMGHTEALSYLAGFLPAGQAGELKEFCRRNGWALLLREPAADDDVPTIVRNRRWIDIIRPVFQLLGTVPGYREFDISFFFLVFFAFFFAVIIGDAGYGMVLLLGTLFFMHRQRRRGQPAARTLWLMMLMSACTVAWGALTGTWFGSARLAALPWLSWMTVPAIASFDPRSSETIKIICFVAGTIQISIAHLWNFIRQAGKKPFIRSLAQLGWLSLVLGLYHLVLNLVLSSERFPVPAYAAWMMAAGLAMIIVFSQQQGRFFHGIAMGLANLMTTFLNGIGAFSDIISYIRLFAVGLATVEIAKSFNAMAANMANGTLGIVLAAIVLLLGHAMNLAMGALSVIVHGVRLNMLEFSGHMGMEWTGRPYKPFKE
jgi:V/A-type H+-transporting ATPase subunit I